MGRLSPGVIQWCSFSPAFGLRCNDPLCGSTRAARVRFQTGSSSSSNTASPGEDEQEDDFGFVAPHVPERGIDFKAVAKCGPCGEHSFAVCGCFRGVSGCFRGVSGGGDLQSRAEISLELQSLGSWSIRQGWAAESAVRSERGNRRVRGVAGAMRRLPCRSADLG